MLRYVLKRLLSSAITIWIVITLTFFLMHKIPGGPFDSEKKLPDQVKQTLREVWT